MALDATTNNRCSALLNPPTSAEEGKTNASNAGRAQKITQDALKSITIFLGLQETVIMSQVSRAWKEATFSHPVNVNTVVSEYLTNKLRATQGAPFPIPQKIQDLGQQKVTSLSLRINFLVSPIFLDQIAPLFPKLHSLYLGCVSKEYGFEAFTALKHLQLTQYTTVGQLASFMITGICQRYQTFFMTPYLQRIQNTVTTLSMALPPSCLKQVAQFFPHLDELCIHQASDAHVQILDSFPNLRTLSLGAYNSRLTGAHIGNLPKTIEALYVYGPIQDPFFKDMDLPQLQSLRMTEANVTGEFLQYLYPALRTLRLVRSDRLSDEVMNRYLARFTELEDLNVSNTNIRGPFLGSVSNHLRILDCSACEHLEDAPFQANMSRFVHLEELYLTSTRLKGDFIPDLAPTLKRLRVNFCSLIADAVFQRIAQLNALEYLDISDTQLTGDFLPNMTAPLKELHCSRTRVTDRSLINARFLGTLNRLDCPETAIEGAFIKELISIQYLDIEKCSRVIIAAFQDVDKRLTQLKYLYLHKSGVKRADLRFQQSVRFG